jgi:hypothetical protein
MISVFKNPVVSTGMNNLIASQTNFDISRFGQTLSAGLHKFSAGSKRGSALARALAAEILENYLATGIDHDFDCQPIEADYFDASDSFRVLVHVADLRQIFTVTLEAA